METTRLLGQISPVFTEKGVGSGEEMSDFVRSLVSASVFLRRPYCLALT